MRYAYRVLLIIGMLASPTWHAVASTQQPEIKIPPSRTQVLKTIDILVLQPQPDRIRSSFSLILDFAETSDEVHVLIGLPYFDFGGSKRLGDILLAYFVAGAVKFDLENPSLADDPQADAGSAIRTALVYYRIHRQAHPADTHPLFEHFDVLDREGKLDRFIASHPPEKSQ
jgi:hypothetical protein